MTHKLEAPVLELSRYLFNFHDIRVMKNENIRYGGNAWDWFLSETLGEGMLNQGGTICFNIKMHSK